MSELAKRIWDLLDDEVKLNKDMIAALTNSDERTVRRAIKELRDNGYNVATDSHTGGYWKGNAEDRRRTVAELRARAYKELATARALEMGPSDQIAIELKKMGERA
jgi:transcription initiation factor IIE alpha subunit